MFYGRGVSSNLVTLAQLDVIGVCAKHNEAMLLVLFGQEVVSIPGEGPFSFYGHLLDSVWDGGHEGRPTPLQPGFNGI